MANWFLNTMVVFAVPQLLLVDKGDVFFAFSGVCVISIILVDLFLPETSGRSLEQSSSNASNNSVLMKLFRGMCCKASSRNLRIQSDDSHQSNDSDSCTMREPCPEDACVDEAGRTPPIHPVSGKKHSVEENKRFKASATRATGRDNAKLPSTRCA